MRGLARPLVSFLRHNKLGLGQRTRPVFFADAFPGKITLQKEKQKERGREGGHSYLILKDSGCEKGRLPSTIDPPHTTLIHLCPSPDFRDISDALAAAAAPSAVGRCRCRRPRSGCKHPPVCLSAFTIAVSACHPFLFPPLLSRSCTVSLPRIPMEWAICYISSSVPHSAPLRTPLF